VSRHQEAVKALFFRRSNFNGLVLFAQ